MDDIFCWALTDESENPDGPCEGDSLIGLFPDPAAAFECLTREVGYLGVEWTNAGYNPGYWHGWLEDERGREHCFTLSWNRVRRFDDRVARSDPPPEHMAQLPPWEPAADYEEMTGRPFPAGGTRRPT